MAGAELSIRRIAVVEMLIVPTFFRDASLARDYAIVGYSRYGATGKVRKLKLG